MLNVGDTITFGLFSNREGVPTPIDWFVHKQQNNLAQLVIKDISLVRHSYDTEPYDHFGEGDVAWKYSELRNWLNTDFFETAFSPSEQRCIVDTIINDESVYECYDCGDYEYYFKGRYYTVPTSTTRDKVFIPKFGDFAYSNDRGTYAVKEDYAHILKAWQESTNFSNNGFTMLDLFKVTDSWKSDRGHLSHVCFYLPASPERLSIEAICWHSHCSMGIPVSIWIDISKYENSLL